MIQIEPDALQRLKQMHDALGLPCVGLRLWARGNQCQGVELGMHWAGSQSADDFCFEMDGLTILADSRQWPFLDQCQISLGEKNGISGFSMQPKPQSCECSSDHCSSVQDAGQFQ